jgi:hypothetical protein
MGNGGIAPSFLTSELDGGEWSASSPCRFTAGESTPGTQRIEGWVGSRAGLGADLAPARNRTGYCFS